eukprot:3042007-Amphidinium_carterae.1
MSSLIVRLQEALLRILSTKRRCIDFRGGSQMLRNAFDITSQHAEEPDRCSEGLTKETTRGNFKLAL